MRRNPYWPLKGPSSFSVLTFRRCVFSRCTKSEVGFGSNFAARMASRQTKVETEVSRSLRQRRTQNMLVGPQPVQYFFTQYTKYAMRQEDNQLPRQQSQSVLQMVGNSFPACSGLS